MTTAGKVLRYQLRELARSRAVAGYAAFVLLVTAGLLHFGGGPGRALPSLATVVVLVVPLVCLLMSTSFVYHGGDFIELLLAHPVGRRPLFAGMYFGLTLPLAAAFVFGAGLPLVSSGALASYGPAVVLLLLTGVLLTTVFTSIGFLVALRVREPATGMGLALVLWLALAVLYDGAVLLAAYRWASYPLEIPMLVLMALNPVDVARVLVVMALDASAMMGYTGAVFQDFFAGGTGLGAALVCLLTWTLVPGVAALRAFAKKDF
jgi:Cu-processing system permease protein